MDQAEKANPQKTLDMGTNTSKVFAGKTNNQTNIEMYGETADFFTSEIRKRLSPDKSYTLLDIGSFQGELLQDIIGKLPEYNFKTIAVDTNKGALDNNTADTKILSSAEELPFDDKSINIAIVRYLLQWNVLEKQQEIINELSRVIDHFAIIEHVGSDIVDADGWRKNMDDLFDGEEIPKMKRSDYFFSSRDEVESWMSDQGIKFECIKDRVIENGADVYIERYGLSPEEAERARDILGDKNYFRQTDWVIFPR